MVKLKNGMKWQWVPQLDTLICQINKRSQGTRPSNPTTLDFDEQEDSLPDFLKDDIWVKDPPTSFLHITDTVIPVHCEGVVPGRHLQECLWPLQAVVVHSRIHMTGRQHVTGTTHSRHHERTFRGWLHCCNEASPTPFPLTTFPHCCCAIFELAVWNAMKTVFPWVELHGRGFHWSQAVWKHVMDLGLARSYMEKALTHNFIRCLFARPLLPAAAITLTFDAIFALPGFADELRHLLHIRNTRITSRVWAPASWSVYNGVVQINNDVEGWHRQLN